MGMIEQDLVFPHPPDFLLSRLKNPVFRTMFNTRVMPNPPVANTIYPVEMLLVDKPYDKIITGAFLTLLNMAGPVAASMCFWNITVDKPSEMLIGNNIYPFGSDPTIGGTMRGPMWAGIWGAIAGSNVEPAYNSAVPVQTINVPVGVPPAAGTWTVDAFNIANAAHTTVVNGAITGCFKAQMCQIITKNTSLFLNCHFLAPFCLPNVFALSCGLTYWTGEFA